MLEALWPPALFQYRKVKSMNTKWGEIWEILCEAKKDIEDFYDVMSNDKRYKILIKKVEAARAYAYERYFEEND